MIVPTATLMLAVLTVRPSVVLRRSLSEHFVESLNQQKQLDLVGGWNAFKSRDLKIGNHVRSRRCCQKLKV